MVGPTTLSAQAGRHPAQVTSQAQHIYMNHIRWSPGNNVHATLRPTLLGCFDCAIVQPGSRVNNRDNLTRERGSSKSLSSVLDVHIGSSVALQYTLRGRRSTGRGAACGCLVVVQGAIGAMGKEGRGLGQRCSRGRIFGP